MFRKSCLGSLSDQWFSNNGMKTNAYKNHLLLSTKEKLTAYVSNFKTTYGNKEKLLGVTIDSHLKCESHIESLCSISSQKLYAISRLLSYMNLDQRRLIIKSSNNSQFGYCPLIWMNHSRELNNILNRIHKLTFRIIYRDGAIDELLEKYKNGKIHFKKIQVLLTERFNA